MRISMIDCPECDLLFARAEHRIGDEIRGYVARVPVQASALAGSPQRARIIARARERAVRQLRLKAAP